MHVCMYTHVMYTENLNQHFMYVSCSCYIQELIERVKGTQRGGEFKAADEDGKLAMILDGACKERRVGMAIRKMWKKRFV